MQMRSDKIKKEFFKRISEWIIVWQKIENFEKHSGISGDELIDQSNDDYIKLLDKSNAIKNEIGELLIQTKYFPVLLGLDKRIRGMSLKELVQGFVKIATVKEKDIEAFLETIFENKKDDMIRRMQKLSPLILDVHLNSAIESLHEEVIRCYVQGSFKASCALCRVIAESIAIKFIDDKGHSDLLKGKDSQKKKPSIPAILRNRLFVSEKIVGLYSKIVSKADNVLHNKDEKADEEDALCSIELLHSFVEKFPRTL